MRRRRKWWSPLAAGLALAAAMALTGCTSSGYPADPEGAFDKATNGTLNVGVVHHLPYVDASGAEPSGPEVELVEGFARKNGAEIPHRGRLGHGPRSRPRAPGDRARARLRCPAPGTCRPAA